MTNRVASWNRVDLTDYALQRYRCSEYQQNKPALQDAAEPHYSNCSRLSKPQDVAHILDARNTDLDLGTRSKNWVQHFRRNMDFEIYKRIASGFSSAVIVDKEAVFYALTEPYQGTVPEHLRYNVELEPCYDIVVDPEDREDEIIFARRLFMELGFSAENDSYKDTKCLHIVLSYRHEHPDERARKGYHHRQRASEQTYREIAANIVRIASKYGMAGIRIWTDQHYAIRRSTEDWIEEALMPYAMYQVYYHNRANSAGEEGDETRAWIFAEHTFAMLGFGLCSNVPELPKSWKIHEPEDSLVAGTGRLQPVILLLSTAGARIQCFISQMHAYNSEDVELVKRWSLSINFYGSFYSDDALQGRQPVDGLEWIALSNAARSMNTPTIAMVPPRPGSVYSCREQTVVVSPDDYRSWNGISEFAGGPAYDTKTDKHAYVPARLNLELQMRATLQREDEADDSEFEKYLVALIATSGHGYNFVEVVVEKTCSEENCRPKVLEWRRLSEYEIVMRRDELLSKMRVPLDNPDNKEIGRRWGSMLLPISDANIDGLTISWF